MLRLQMQGVYPAAFGEIDLPVVMLHGAADPHPGKLIYESLKPHLPQLEYVEFADCGHYPWLERVAKEEFTAVLREWLGRLHRRGGWQPAHGFGRQLERGRPGRVGAVALYALSSEELSSKKTRPETTATGNQGGVRSFPGWEQSGNAMSRCRIGPECVECRRQALAIGIVLPWRGPRYGERAGDEGG